MSIGTSLQRRYKSYLYLFDGVSIIQKAYNLSHPQYFVIETPGKRHYVVSSPDHIRAVDKALRSCLSLNAIAKDVSGFFRYYYVYRF